MSPNPYRTSDIAAGSRRGGRALNRGQEVVQVAKSDGGERSADGGKEALGNPAAGAAGVRAGMPAKLEGEELRVGLRVADPQDRVRVGLG